MRILVACEQFGRVRQAFLEKGGHDVYSCDIAPSAIPSDRHIQCDVRDVLDMQWDMMLAFPPCTYLARSGARWWGERQQEQEEAIAFVRTLMSANIPRICIENPIGKISTVIRKPDQIIQPWQHGHGETKATCLWLKNLPLLQPSHIVDGRKTVVHFMQPGPNRGIERSKTYQGIADAMASQWGTL